MFFAIAVVNDLSDLEPDITRPQGMPIALALVIVPIAVESLRRYETGDIDAQITGTAKTTYLAIGIDLRGAPLLYERFPFFWREQTDPPAFGIGTPQTTFASDGDAAGEASPISLRSWSEIM